MRVSVEYYMQRRNLGWSSFLGWDYDRFETWCHVRKIIPLNKEDFLNKILPFEDTTIEAPPEEPKEELIQKEVLPDLPDGKTLSRKRKDDLIEIAHLYGIELSGSETKKQIVQYLDNLNNDSV